MFLNNPASTRSILANDENAAVGPRSKSAGKSGVKKTGFDENKTPHRNKASSKNGQNTQRRRRALGDISNRKAAGGGGGGKQGSLKPGKALFPSSSAKPRTAQLKFSKTPAAKTVATSKAPLGGVGGAKGANSKPEQRTSSAGGDGVFGPTTRWSGDDVANEGRSPFDLVPEEELDMLSDLQDEMLRRHKEENDERDGLERERCDEQLSERIRAVHEANDRDVAEMGTMRRSCGISGDDPWDLLDRKLPWEGEDEIDRPLEERGPSGLDPYGLWDDI